MEMSGQSHVLAALPPMKQPQVHFELEAGWAPRGGLDVIEKRFFSPAGIRTPDRPVHNLVIIQTMISSETFVFTYKNTWRHDLQDHTHKLFQILNSPIRSIS